MVNFKVFALNKPGNYKRIIKLKQNMIFAEVNKNFFFILFTPFYMEFRIGGYLKRMAFPLL